MPSLSGLETVQPTLAEEPDQAIVIFTTFRDPVLERTATARNARACLAKSDLELVMSAPGACKDGTAGRPLDATEKRSHDRAAASSVAY